MRPEDDPGWASYPETVLEVDGGVAGRVVIDLRRPIDPAAMEACSRIGLSPPWVVVTACNPAGRGFEPPALAAAADARLAAAMRAAADGGPVLRATGRSPDGTHAEPGWAARLDPNTGRRLARAFGQSAIFGFLVDDPRAGESTAGLRHVSAWVLPVIVDAVPRRLPALP